MLALSAIGAAEVSASEKWLTMGLLCLSGSIMYWLPFFSEIYSVIGYTPDIFVPTVAGIFLDAYPGAEGYQTLFLFVGGLSFLGLMAAYGAYRRIQYGR